MKTRLSTALVAAVIGYWLGFVHGLAGARALDPSTDVFNDVTTADDMDNDR